MPLIGLFYFFLKKSVAKIWIPLILTFSIGIVYSIVQLDFLSFRRSFQAMMMIWFCCFLINEFSNSTFLNLSKNCLFLIIIFHLLQLLYGHLINDGVLSFVEILFNKNFYDLFGFYPRFVVEGILNNANYTGLTLSFIGMYFYLKKKRRLYLASYVFAFLTLSLNAIFCIILFHLLEIINKYKKNLQFKINLIVIIILLLYPIFIYLFEQTNFTNLKIILNSVSGYRYIEHLSFIEAVKNNVFGVGFDKSNLIYEKFSYKGSSLLTEQLIEPLHKNIGPHNTIIKILVELGIFGYFLFFLFILYMQIFLSDKYSNFYNLLPVLLFSFLWIDALTHFFSYFVFAIILRERYFN